MPYSDSAISWAPDVVRRLGRGTVEGWGAATGRWRGLPDYLIIGAQRAGTSTLHEALAASPDVYVSWVKETQYFSTKYAKGEVWYRGHFPLHGARRLAQARGRTVRAGEATPYYLFHPQAPARARALVPDARIIAVLRDPVDRAYSQYKHMVALGLEHLPFEAAVDAECSRIGEAASRLKDDPLFVSVAHQHHSYVSRGKYAEQLERWLRLFPREQVLVLPSERLFAGDGVEIRRVADFIGARPPRERAPRARNARPGEPMKRATEERLRGEFAEANQRLYDLLGVDFGWKS